MAEERLHGKILWRNRFKREGIVTAADGDIYFIHPSNQFRPENHTSVIFSAIGSNAFDIHPDPNAPTTPIIPTANPPAKGLKERWEENAAEIRRAAEEALRLKREQQEALHDEDLTPGTRVFYKPYGVGVVKSAEDQSITVFFDRNPDEKVVVLRAKLSKVAEPIPEPSESKIEIPPILAPFQPEAAPAPIQTITPVIPFASALSTYIQHMASEVYQTLSEEGLEANDVHHYEAPAPVPNLRQSIPMDARVAQAFLTVSKFSQFYSHQVQARQALLEGKNVIISTPTASGKTEAYNPTVLETLLNDPDATALYLFPLVALGLDQTERLEKLNQALPEADRLTIGIYNSSVDKETKNQTLRVPNRILVTTPDSFHYIFLPKPYPNWKNFYRNLRYLVIDEAHLYKGVFGANMANIIRRLLVRCRREGNPRFPQLIISSATIRHPAQLANQLTGLPAEGFEVITQSGAPKTGKHSLVTRSDIHPLESICTDLLNITVRTAENRSRPLSVIVFLRSIGEVKQTAHNLREHLRITGKRDQAAFVDEFYSDKADKTDVLTRLRKGEVRCLFTTTALMAGIDIGSLDVAVVKNFPRLVMDARQMFGRAGRAGEGAVIFIADRTDPFDHFYFEKSALLFQGPTEDVVANPENPILLAAHLQCAAQVTAQYNQEGPLAGEWASLFGAMGQNLLNELVKSGSLSLRNGNYVLTIADDPHDLPPLDKIRTMSGETYSLTDTNGQLLEEKRQETAFRDAHREAIIRVNGRSYKVIGFDIPTRKITCQPHSEHDTGTKGIEEKSVKILTTDVSQRVKNISLYGGVTLQRGVIEIATGVNSYLLYKIQPVMQCRNRKCRYETPNLDTKRCLKCNSPVRSKNHEEVVDEYAMPTPPALERKMRTRAVWLNLPVTLREQFTREFWPRWEKAGVNNQASESAPDFGYAIHSLEHVILKAFPEYVRCDQDEIAGVYQLDLDGLAGRLFLYDNFPGGLGLSEEFLFNAQSILTGALDLIERCTCIDDEGCPVCLAYFGCHCFNQALSKLAGRYLLCVLLEKSTQNVLDDLAEYIAIRIPVSNRIDKAPRK